MISPFANTKNLFHGEKEARVSANPDLANELSGEHDKVAYTNRTDSTPIKLTVGDPGDKNDEAHGIDFADTTNDRAITVEDGHPIPCPRITRGNCS